MQVIAGETPRAANDFNRNYGIRCAMTLLNLDYSLFSRGFSIGLNHHLVVIDADGIIRCRCAVMKPFEGYCGKEGNPRCQGHTANMMVIVKNLLSAMPPGYANHSWHP